ncbi:DUF1236 domain-containing protein [Methylocapsa palsarum]|uniref:DUF1236 domain-containing protein n=1 Tax=Methylocapsa palsarum TaxID=1612308 RepID=A0A1I3ZPQ5_9HYPH|nr:DUF1236 domain-containing protein [Methylocapsa palsarum]SFK45671.1 Protein of unknown function [Methylocapsa palsarum]
MQKRFGIAVVAALAASPLAVHAQGMVGGMTNGMEQGSAQGGAAAGPIGGLAGGVVGGVGGLLGADQSGPFNAYALREGRSSYRYDSELRPGALLPRQGVAYYRVPPKFGVSPSYRYAIVNDRAVLVDPRTHRIVQVLD